MKIITDRILTPNRLLPLYSVCSKVTEDDSKEEIIDKLHKSIEENNAYGCAANQLGITKQIFSMRVSPESVIRDFINPEIISSSINKKYFLEGCLSFPNFYVKIKRPVKILLKYQDLDGKEHTENFYQLESRIIQHEMDHLAGKRFFDHANKYHFDKAMKDYNGRK